MLKFTIATDPRLARFPPEHRQPLERAITTLCSIYPPDPDPDRQGFVAFIEPMDRPRDLPREIGCTLERGLECAYRDEACLIGVVLWGNSGEGVTIVCPEHDSYAPEIARILREHLL